MAEVLGNDLAFELASGINASTTSISVVDATHALDVPFRVRIDNEFLLVTAVAGTNWTVQREAEDSDRFPAAPHSAGAAIHHVLTRDALTNWLSGLMLDVPRGDCRFIYTSSSVATLIRFNGRYLWINGANREIPSAGVTLANSALASNSTDYHVYAYMSGGAITLEASTTAPVVGPDGIMVKDGDPSRTLVGMARKDGSGNFLWNDANKFILSWFNRRMQVVSSAVFFGSTSSTTLVPVGNTCSMLFWGGEALLSAVNGYVRADPAGNYTVSTIYINGAQRLGAATIATNAISGADFAPLANNNFYITPANSLYTAQLAVSSAAGTSYYNETVHLYGMM